MASYAIMRVQKLKTNTSVRGSLKHAFREIETPNSEESKRGENSHYGATSAEEAMKAYKDLLPEKIRKNGVRCLEYLMTASPEKMKEMSKEQQDSYFTDCKEWLEERHGAENVFYAGVHRDETTPHMYAYVVPLSQQNGKEGKLNAREFVGGHKNNLSELQSDFAERVGKPHGMERGVKGSKASHKAIKTYYAEVSDLKVQVEDIKQPRMLKKGVFVNKVESKQDVIDRVAQRAGQVSQGAADLTRKVKQQEATIESLDSQLKEFGELRGMDKADKDRILSEVKAVKAKRQAERKRDRVTKQRSRSTER